MLSKAVFLGASALFLAFAGLSSDDLRVTTRHGSEPEHPVTVPGSEVAAAHKAVAGPEDAELSSDAARVEEAVSVLSTQIRRQSHPDALRYAIRAYYNFQDRYPERVRKPYLYFVDFGLDSRTPRGYVFDMSNQTRVEGPFMVAHGRGSVVGDASVPSRFRNTSGSNATSLGLYIAQETYAFRGKSAGRSYKSIGLRLDGVSGSFNNRARARGIVVHGAPYVTRQRAGRSEGCPAMELELAQRLIQMIANGGLVFHFSPADREWMQEDPWVTSPMQSASADKAKTAGPSVIVIQVELMRMRP